jgi:hypothetical protein
MNADRSAQHLQGGILKVIVFMDCTNGGKTELCPLLQTVLKLTDMKFILVSTKFFCNAMQQRNILGTTDIVTSI